MPFIAPLYPFTYWGAAHLAIGPILGVLENLPFETVFVLAHMYVLSDMKTQS